MEISKIPSSIDLFSITDFYCIAMHFKIGANKTSFLKLDPIGTPVKGMKIMETG